MRVIGGALRGRRLGTPAGTSLRPTSDRVREALFNILAPWVDGAWFLDLYAGTGAVAIEALSRGCRGATLVEQDPSHAALLRRNLGHCGLLDRAQVLVEPARGALRRLGAGPGRFDLIFVDPPYAAAEERRGALEALVAAGPALSGARIVVEGPSRGDFPRPAGLELQRLERYGDSSLAFYLAGQG